MALINGDELRDAPNKLTVPPGVFDVMIEGIPEVKRNRAQDGDNMVLVMSIVNNPEHEGKKLFEHLPISGSAKSKPFREARLHHVLKCFGFDLAGQINTDDLAGRIGRVAVKEEISEDPNTKIKTMRSVIDQYIPLDGAAGSTANTGGPKTTSSNATAAMAGVLEG